MIAAPIAPLETFRAHLESLDAGAAAALVDQALAAGSPLTDVACTIVLPAWESLERRSREGEIDVAVSGAAAAIARRAIQAGAARTGVPRRVGRPAVVIVAAEGIGEALGAEVAAQIAAAAGWPVEVVGVDDLDGALQRRPALAVVVTGHDPIRLPLLVGAVACAHASGVPVLACGRAFGSEESRALKAGAEQWLDSPSRIAAILDAWNLEAPTLRESRALPEGHRALDRQSRSLVAATASIGSGEGEAGAWAERASVALVEYLCAAVALDAPDLFAEALGTQLAVVRASSSLHEVHLVGLVDALAAALPADAVAARDYVLAGRETLRRSLLGPPRLGRSGGAQARPSDDSAAPGEARRLIATGILRAAVEGGATPEAPDPGPGQVFADLLLLAALACQTPMAIVSVPQGGGRWSTLSYGFEQRDGLNDAALFDLVAGQSGPVQISDIGAHPDLARSPLARSPHNLRWVYAVALHDPAGNLLGVVAVVDRWLRDLTRREQRGLAAAGRQIGIHLAQLRRTVPVPAPTPSPAWIPPSAPAVGPVRPDPLAGLVGGRRGPGLPEGQQLLRSHEVAVLFDVTERTVINWAAAGKLPSLRTIGGHLRFRTEDVLELLAGRAPSVRTPPS